MRKSPPAPAAAGPELACRRRMELLRPGVDVTYDFLFIFDNNLEKKSGSLCAKFSYFMAKIIISSVFKNVANIFWQKLEQWILHKFYFMPGPWHHYEKGANLENAVHNGCSEVKSKCRVK
jgi:hypothetical protein